MLNLVDLGFQGVGPLKQRVHDLVSTYKVVSDWHVENLAAGARIIVFEGKAIDRR